MTLPYVRSVSLSETNTRNIVSGVYHLTQFVNNTALPSFQSFGGTGDGQTSNSTAANNAITASAGGHSIYLSEGTYKTTLGSSQFIGMFWGDGQFEDVNSNKRGKYLTALTTQPSSFGNHDSVETAFNGDLSHSMFQFEHRITGANTLTQPTSGYVYVEEAYPFYGYLYNASGFNHGTADNSGRTAACFFRIKADNHGQGDCVAYNGTAFVTGARAGATNFLANPAATLFNGDISAGQAGVYLNPCETNINDQGFDVAGIGAVHNLDRNNATGNLSAVWTGTRFQSIGGSTVDNIIAATGPFLVGIDFAMAGLDFGANKAAISLKADDRIYFNNSAGASGNLQADWRTTSFNAWYLEYSSSLSGLVFVANNVGVLQITGNQVSVTAPLVGTNYIQTGTSLTTALPSASGIAGARFFVTDATTTTFGSTFSGSGTGKVPVYSDGTNWRVG